jgi:hypothetical protein
VLEAQQHVQAGYRVVVDVDLEKFFDRCERRREHAWIWSV